MLSTVRLRCAYGEVRVWPRGEPGRSCWQQADTSSAGPKCPSARVLHGSGALAKPGAKRQTQAGIAGWPGFDPDFAEEPGLIEPYLSAIRVRTKFLHNWPFPQYVECFRSESRRRCSARCPKYGQLLRFMCPLTYWLQRYALPLSWQPQFHKPNRCWMPGRVMGASPLLRRMLLGAPPPSAGPRRVSRAYRVSRRQAPGHAPGGRAHPPPALPAMADLPSPFSRSLVR